MCNTKMSDISRQKEEIIQNFVRRDHKRVRQAPDRDIALAYHYQKAMEEMSNDPGIIHWEITQSFNHLFIEHFKIHTGLQKDVIKALHQAKKETRERFDNDLLPEQEKLLLIPDQELLMRLVKTLAYEEYLQRFYDIHTRQDLSGTDDRIKNCMCNKEEVREYFLQLKKFKVNNIQVFTENQIDDFLHANFVDFNPKKPRKKMQCPPHLKKDIRQLVYTFYLKCSQVSRTDEYAALLKNNFQVFDDTSLESLKKNFSR